MESRSFGMRLEDAKRASALLALYGPRERAPLIRAIREDLGFMPEPGIPINPKDTQVRLGKQHPHSK